VREFTGRFEKAPGFLDEILLLSRVWGESVASPLWGAGVVYRWPIAFRYARFVDRPRGIPIVVVEGAAG
jgi:hypothetical protein